MNLGGQIEFDQYPGEFLPQRILGVCTNSLPRASFSARPLIGKHRVTDQRPGIPYPGPWRTRRSPSTITCRLYIQLNCTSVPWPSARRAINEAGPDGRVD